MATAAGFACGGSAAAGEAGIATPGRGPLWQVIAHRRNGVPPQRLDLAPRELPALPGQQVAERQAADGDPLELMHLVAEAGEHPADLTIAALVEHHLEHGALAPLAPHVDPLRVHLPLGKPHALPQLFQQLFVRHARDLHQVFFLDAIPRVGEQIGELAIVREQDEALARAVEPPDGEEPLLSGHEIDDPRPPRGIVVGRDHPHRLVEHVDEAADPREPLPVDADLLGAGIDTGAERRDHLAVDLDTARRNELLAGPAAAETGRREHFLEPFQRVVGVSPGGGGAKPTPRFGGRAGRPSAGRLAGGWHEWLGGEGVRSRA